MKETDHSNLDGRSALWSMIAPNLNQTDFKIFRSPDSEEGGRLAHWRLNERSLRWFKSYLQVAAGGMSLEECILLRKLGQTSIGQPTTVTVAAPDGTDLVVDIDYLLSAEEVCFLSNHLHSAEIRSVCEIGGGFGRTAHTLLNQWDLDSYAIVDLAETLALSQAYLKVVLPDKIFNKVQFVDASDSCCYPTSVDLSIQIDGFQEMDATVIASYYDSLVGASQYSYICNPVGKYDPLIAGLTDVDPEIVRIAHGLGRSQSAVDPWDEVSLDEVRRDHLVQYCPLGYQIVSAIPSRLRPFYLHALYMR